MERCRRSKFAVVVGSALGFAGKNPAFLAAGVGVGFVAPVVEPISLALDFDAGLAGRQTKSESRYIACFSIIYDVARPDSREV